jgi:hypothetical protein
MPPSLPLAADESNPMYFMECVSSGLHTARAGW